MFWHRRSLGDLYRASFSVLKGDSTNLIDGRKLRRFDLHLNCFSTGGQIVRQMQEIVQGPTVPIPVAYASAWRVRPELPTAGAITLRTLEIFVISDIFRIDSVGPTRAVNLGQRLSVD